MRKSNRSPQSYKIPDPCQFPRHPAKPIKTNILVSNQTHRTPRGQSLFAPARAAHYIYLGGSPRQAETCTAQHRGVQTIYLQIWGRRARATTTLIYTYPRGGPNEIATHCFRQPGARPRFRARASSSSPPTCRLHESSAWTSGWKKLYYIGVMPRRSRLISSWCTQCGKQITQKRFFGDAMCWTLFRALAFRESRMGGAGAMISDWAVEWWVFRFFEFGWFGACVCLCWQIW